MEATKQQINEAAGLLRATIDEAREQTADIFGQVQADETYKPVYNAVTLLHEQAMKVAV